MIVVSNSECSLAMVELEVAGLEVAGLGSHMCCTQAVVILSFTCLWFLTFMSSLILRQFTPKCSAMSCSEYSDVSSPRLSPDGSLRNCGRLLMLSALTCWSWKRNSIKEYHLHHLSMEWSHVNRQPSTITALDWTGGLYCLCRTFNHKK